MQRHQTSFLRISVSAALLALSACETVKTEQTTRSGQELLRKGEYARAEVELREAVRLADRGRPTDDLADALTALALAMNRQGRYAEAEPLARRAVAIRQPHGGSALADSLTQLGFSAYGQERLREAEGVYEQVLSIYRRRFGPNHPLTASALHNLALVYGDEGRLDDAERVMTESLAIDDRTVQTSTDDMYRVNGNLAVIKVKRGKYAEAEPLYRRALGITRQVEGPKGAEVMNALDNLANIEAKLGRSDEALSLVKGAAEIYAERMARVTRSEFASAGRELRLRWYVPSSYVEIAADYAAAHPDAQPGLLDESFRLAQRAQASDAAAAAAAVAARFAAGDDTLARMIRQRQDEADQLNRLDRASLQAVAEGRGAAGPQEQRALAARLEATDRDIAARFPGYAALVSPEPVPVAEVQGLLGPEDALLAYVIPPLRKDWFGQDPNRLWVVRKDRAAWFKLDATADEIADMVRTLRAQLEPGPSSRFDPALAHRLEAKLFPFDAELLRGVRRLMIVPHGPLESLPFSVLVMGEPDGGRPDGPDWLVRHYATVTMPSVPTLRALRRLARHAAAPEPFRGIGDPALAGTAGAGRGVDVGRLFTERGSADPDAIRRLPPLPETAEELRALARDLGAGEGSLLLRERATETAVKAADLSKARVVAFATHAAVAGELPGAAEPALVLTPPAVASGEDDGLLTASEAATLKLDADLVILSACDTAAPDGTPGAPGLSGLAKAFIYAGSRSLLVSHWHVRSDAAARLTTGMLGELAREPGLGRAEALRRAEVALMAEPLFADPSAWAPFVVVGEGGPLSDTAPATPVSGAPRAGGPADASGRPRDRARPTGAAAAPD